MSLCGGACAVCYAVGAFFLLSLAVRVLKAVYAAYLRPAEDPKKYGAWAVVTGATDGIGLEYAKQLAAKGMNIVLISRTASKLADVKKEILAADKRDIEVKVIVEDMSGEPTEVYPRIAKQLEGLDIGVLVNNVGISYEHPEFFAALDQERIDALVRLNIVSINQMTRIVLPGMQQRKRGAIVNVSSGSGTLPTALLTAYSATKAYVDFFSRGLAVEVEKDGVFVQPHHATKCTIVQATGVRLQAYE
ncbi:estradiol 17-beta-dehydrogenase 12 [Salpingoeca rosetta]|uniref:Estradiol 17-beta-dehydrogenase 12 n=1 Tax=Salpingoeca rosetta (strain ATCC 50818 / BSB-021) TaxID=946362 RepID=F2UMU1_SALR5|nr:estradiol 17-beta-dehydrogenase 12 [Salpingoeca rosetta]EGD78440.1 estradiol 17-beta-dehydrogenase 12 [Salpingoeca rosetta]|eukprot:XP_004989389.1 estradiol 17-beta-dehydrogenase 12 [Salpingoeca rosetta]